MSPNLIFKQFLKQFFFQAPRGIGAHSPLCRFLSLLKLLKPPSYVGYFSFYPWREGKIRKTVANWSYWARKIITMMSISSDRSDQTWPGRSLVCSGNDQSQGVSHATVVPKVTNTGNLSFSSYQDNHVLLLWTCYVIFIILLECIQWKNKQFENRFLTFTAVIREYNFYIYRKKSPKWSMSLSFFWCFSCRCWILAAHSLVTDYEFLCRWSSVLCRSSLLPLGRPQ